MTTGDYDEVMKAIGIADLKAHLSEHLKSVRKGRTLTVLNRDTPVARIVPFTTEALEVRRTRRHPMDLTLPAPPDAPTDSLALLLEDRGRR